MIRSDRIFVAMLIAALAVSLSMPSALQAEPPRLASYPPRIAIIIDDIGHNTLRDRSALSLPTSVAVAVLPHAPNSKAMSELAHRIGHEVLVHLPMQSQLGANAEKIYLSATMSRQDFDAALTDALAQVPHAVGVNNHQGSALTGEREPMRWLMSSLRERGGLYFVDSRTSAASVALEVARAEQVPALTRHVFLDHDRDPAAIVAALHALAARAHKEGYAVAIGHPHPETIETLEWALPQIAAQGIRLVPPSQLLAPPPPATALAKQ